MNQSIKELDRTNIPIQTPYQFKAKLKSRLQLALFKSKLGWNNYPLHYIESFYPQIV